MCEISRKKSKKLELYSVVDVERLTGLTRDQLRAWDKGGLVPRVASESKRIGYALEQVLKLEVIAHLRGTVSTKKATEVIASVSRSELDNILRGDKCFIVGSEVFTWNENLGESCFLSCLSPGVSFFAVIESNGSLLDGLKNRAKVLGLTDISLNLEV